MLTILLVYFLLLCCRPEYHQKKRLLTTVEPQTIGQYSHSFNIEVLRKKSVLWTTDTEKYGHGDDKNYFFPNLSLPSLPHHPLLFFRLLYHSSLPLTFLFPFVQLFAYTFSFIFLLHILLAIIPSSPPSPFYFSFSHYSLPATIHLHTFFSYSYSTFFSFVYFSLLVSLSP
jgi:hypothetical protein